MQSTNGHFLTAIITLFSTLVFVVILVVIFGVIIRRRKESRKKQRSKNENEFEFDNGLQIYDTINENEVNTYEKINYELIDCDIGVYDKINQNGSKIESNTSKTNEYLEISK